MPDQSAPIANGVGATIVPALAVFGLTAALPIASVTPAVTYYYLPLVAFLACFALVWLGRAGARRVWPAIVLSALIGLICAAAIGSIIGHLLMTRWLAWGLFPINDAADFFASAQRLLTDGRFETPRGRVLSNVIYGGWLWLSGFDMRVILWGMTALVALAIAAAATSMLRALGWTAAAVGAYMLLDFVHEHIGGTTTEVPGFLFGLGGFALVLSAARSRSPASFVAGFVLICVAMLTRVGAVFLLPALLLWSAFALRGTAHKVLVPGLGVAIMALAFAANSSLTAHYAPNAGGGFVNAVDSWYASVVEGEVLLGRRDAASVVPATPWVQIYRDHPDIKALPEADQPARKIEIFTAKLEHAPLAALAGGAAELGRFVFHLEMFRFINISAVRFVIFALALIGFASVIRTTVRERDPVAGLLALSTLAILASQPFLLGGESRTPAPSVGFLAALVGWGAQVAVRRISRRREAAVTDNDGAGFPVFAAAPSCILLGLAAAGAMAAGSWRGQIGDEVKCEIGETAALVRYDLASGIRVDGNGWSETSLAAHQSWLVTLRETRNRLRKPLYEPRSEILAPLVAAAASLPRGGFVTQATDIANGRPLPLVTFDADTPPAPAGDTTRCLAPRDGFVSARTPSSADLD